MARPQVADGGDGLQIWRAAVNILNVQCFLLITMKPLMMAKTGRNMQHNLCIHNKLGTSEGILYTFACILHAVTEQDA
jgi:hypothetical protein